MRTLSTQTVHRSICAKEWTAAFLACSERAFFYVRLQLNPTVRVADADVQLRTPRSHESLYQTNPALAKLVACRAADTRSCAVRNVRAIQPLDYLTTLRQEGVSDVGLKKSQFMFECSGLIRRFVNEYDLRVGDPPMAFDSKTTILQGR